MQVEQAVFTSTRSRRAQGYHLVAQSPGVGERLARLLSSWGPSHASLLSDQPGAFSFNFHPLTKDQYAVSRTMHGGPEYSGRGGLQVFTHFLVFQAEQLEAYENDALQLARTAHTMGYLRLIPNVPERLPTLQLPARPITFPLENFDHGAVPLHDVLRILRMQNRVAILGLADPLSTLERILTETPRHERLHVSFTTGLRPSVHRDFRVHFAHQPDAALHAQLASEGIDYVTTV